MPRLEDLPRAAIGTLPTPLHDLPRLARHLGLERLLVKRDDLTGLGLGGNKVRKLRYVVAEALRQGADTLITAAERDSNRAQLTAAACRQVGLDCVLLLCGADETAQPNLNLWLAELFGARVRFVATPYFRDPAVTRAAEEVAAALRARGRRPYLTEIGPAADPLLEAGYVAAADELVDQCAALGVEPAAILLATGSGSQQAGVLVGLRARGARTRVIGVAAAPGEAQVRARVEQRASAVVAWLGLPAPHLPDDVWLDGRFASLGLGEFDERSLEAVRLVARLEGLAIDPVYVGKVVAAIPGLLRAGWLASTGTVVLWHTGGATTLLTHAAALRASDTDASDGGR